MPARTDQREHPIWRLYDISELSRLTTYSEDYLLKLKGGYQPLTQRFMERMAKQLHRPESELFGEAEG